MSVPPRLETPEKQVIEKELRRLCSKALRRHWIHERGKGLMGLDCVRAHLVVDPDEEAYVDALRSYLEEAIQRLESRERRIVLEVVLGLGDDRWKSKEWRHESAEVRRKEAGHVFRGDEEDDVEGNTIRKVHERNAVADLTEIILADELRLRNPPEGDTPA